MTTRISRIESDGSERTTLRVEGSLRVEDAEVLEQAFAKLQQEESQQVAIDLSGLSFLDSDSASVLCRLRDAGVELVGLHFFTRRLIEMAENPGE